MRGAIPIGSVQLRFHPLRLSSPPKACRAYQNASWGLVVLPLHITQRFIL